MRTDAASGYDQIVGDANALRELARNGDFQGTMAVASKYASDVAALQAAESGLAPDSGTRATRRTAIARVLAANVDTVTLLAARRDELARLLAAESARTRLAHAYGTVVAIRPPSER